MSKICSKCDLEKTTNSFISHDRRICKECANKISREKHKLIVLDPNIIKICKWCEIEKPETEFIKKRAICKDCNNKQRRNKYESDPNVSDRLKENARIFKSKKTKERQDARALALVELENRIGKENTICKYCELVKPKTRFRHNRLKCADCERDDPYAKFTRNIRSDINTRLHGRKDKHTIEYLGCTYQDFIEWMTFVKPDFTIENHGDEWHIDHVIPISRFDMDNKDDVHVSWNWRNTTPLPVYENLAKNNKIIKEQISDHYKKLVEFHTLKSITIPQEFIILFAKHLDAGNPLEL